MSLVLEPYEEYKESRLPWLGRCPTHWSIRRMKYLVDERVRKGFPDEPLLTASQSRGVIRKSDYGLRTVEAQKDLHLLKLVEPGDYVISLRSFQGGIEYAHQRGIISPAYTVLRPKPKVRKAFYEYFFKSPAFINSMTLFVTGIREGQNIDYVRLSRAYMPCPPIEEQEAIGRFLRHLDHRVNKLIRTKKRLIELLNEQKQAIIHRAVTRGIDSNVPMKPSGVEWLREIPAHWDVKRIKEVARLNPSRTELGHIALETLVTVLPMEAVSEWGGVDMCYETPAAQVQKGMTYMRNGDVSIAKITPCFENGKGASLKNLPYGFAYGSTEFHVLRPGRMLSSDFLYYVTRMPKFRELGEFNMRGSAGQKRVPVTFIANFLIALPAPEEQAEIVSYIEEQRQSVEATISRTLAEIALIRQYRECLVADVVTGQLDVRNVDTLDVSIDSIAPLGIDDIEEQDEELEDELVGDAM